MIKPFGYKEFFKVNNYIFEVKTRKRSFKAQKIVLPIDKALKYFTENRNK